MPRIHSAGSASQFFARCIHVLLLIAFTLAMATVSHVARAQTSAPVTVAGTSMCADVGMQSQAPGAQVITWPCNGGANENWLPSATGARYNLISQNSGLCLDVSSQSPSPGGLIIQWTCNGGLNQAFSLVHTGAMSGGGLLIIFALVVAVTCAIVFMERSQRRLLVQYPKRQVGNRMFGGDTSFLPLKINTSGVIPPIFASSLLLLPSTVMGFAANANLPNWLQWLPGAVAQLSHGRPLFMVTYGLLIVFFCFFYTSVVFNPEDTAENLRKYGGFMPGIRPGKRTAEYLDYVLTRLTVIGAVYIAAVCLLPEALMASNSISTYYFGGTSILIVVSVTMDTVAQIQSHLLAHQYEGLIKKSKLRGGRR